MDNNKKVIIERSDNFVFANGWTFTPEDGVDSIAYAIKDLLEELGIEVELKSR
jgi:hypothetical protein